jgi:monoamine oxidase
MQYPRASAAILATTGEERVMREREADVVVIGAGLAGLSAARALRARGAEVLVLEARKRVGGRTLNHSIGDGKVVEIGGQWVGPGQDRVLALISELGLETFDTHAAGRNLFERRGRVRAYRGEIPHVNPLALMDVQLALTRLERMARTVAPESPWLGRSAGAWDAQTVASWTRRHMRTGLGRKLIALACEAVWAADPAEVSLLHFLAYASSGGGLQRLISTDGGAQQARIVGGSQRIALSLAESLGQAVLLDEPVSAIEHGEGVRVSARTLSVSARRAIVAMSPALAGRLRYAPALPARRDQLTQRMPNGSVIKCMAIYDGPFWRERGLSGQVTSDGGPVKVVFDNSPPDGSPGVLLGFLEGNQARAFGGVPAGERREAVVSCFARFFGERAAEPLDYVEKDWSADEWTRGCYGAFMPPNTWSAFGDVLREPVGALHWAGAETATVWMGYMDGAVRSGERAAAEVAEALPRRAALA